MVDTSVYRRCSKLLAVEEIEKRICLSAVSFAAHDIILSSAASSLYGADIDGDGDVDVLSTSRGDHKVAWYENTDGEGTFGPQKVISTAAPGANSVISADVHGDGDQDVLSASSWGRDDRIAWYENADGKGSFGPQQIITTGVDEVTSVFAADVDGDGDLDILSASRNDHKIAWYENTNSEGSFGPQRVITRRAILAKSVFAVAVDGDGDVDVISSSRHEEKIAWYENTDGKGRFGPQAIITNTADRSQSVYAADVDGDGDVDVLSAGGNKIAWYENNDNKGSFGGQQIITAAADDARLVFAIDVDGDGDVDVLSANDAGTAWYENTDAKGSFGLPIVIDTKEFGPASVYAADLDSDGDLDVVSASENKIAWYENTSGRGSFASPSVISTDASNARSVYAADIDDDGDLDILSALGSFSPNYPFGEVIWYENIDGKGSFGPQMVVAATNGGALSVYALDMDSDGDLDVLSASSTSASGRIAWYERLPHVVAGDANRDSQFDQQDIVQVLQSAKYLTGESATNEEGDWNRDGVFDQLDIVAALQTGNYLKGA